MQVLEDRLKLWLMEQSLEVLVHFDMDDEVAQKNEHIQIICQLLLGRHLTARYDSIALDEYYDEIVLSEKLDSIIDRIIKSPALPKVIGHADFANLFVTCVTVPNVSYPIVYSNAMKIRGLEASE